MHFDREKYLRMAQVQGIHIALTQLHKDMMEWEHEAFEGPKGWNPEQWRTIQEDARAFSRELWDMALRKGAAQN